MIVRFSVHGISPLLCQPWNPEVDCGEYLGYPSIWAELRFHLWHRSIVRENVRVDEERNTRVGDATSWRQEEGFHWHSGADYWLRILNFFFFFQSMVNTFFTSEWLEGSTGIILSGKEEGEMSGEIFVELSWWCFQAELPSMIFDNTMTNLGQYGKEMKSKMDSRRYDEWTRAGFESM